MSLPSSSSSPLVELLAAGMRDLRVKAGMSTNQRHPSKRTIERIEQGSIPRVRPGIIAELCRLYKADNDVLEKMVLLAEATQEDHWWDRFNDGMEDHFWLYLLLEQHTRRIKCHDTNLIPALAQHESYIDALYDTIRIWSEGNIDPEAAKQLRLKRQERWFDSRIPTTMIIGQPALDLGMPSHTEKTQRDHLVALSERDHVDILVAPMAAGKYDLYGAEVNIMTTYDEAVIYSFGSHDGRYADPASNKGQRYLKGFDEAITICTPVKEFLCSPHPTKL